jgi:O-methyltransferase
VRHSLGSESSAFRYRLKKLAKDAVRAAGYEVRRTGPLPLRVPGIPHADVLPVATYSPWLADEEFLKVHEAIKGNTLVDRYRCYELWQLVAEVAKFPSGDLIEIGVWRGGTGALIAKKCQLMGIDATVNLCDTFTGVVKAGSADAGYTGGEHADTTKDEVTRLCRSLNLDRVRILEGIFPEQSGHLVSERQFRFCHIDVDVYQSAMDISEWIWPRLVPGGLVVYDDYGFYTCAGITKFVNMEREKPDRIVIHNLNGHAIVVKTGAGVAG